MLVTKLIEKLQQMVEDRKAVEEIMGPAEIMIDVFKLTEIVNENGQLKKVFKYAGFSPDIRVERSGDGVYPILSGFAE